MGAPATPMTPGAIIGHRRDGRPIRLIGGAADTGVDSTVPASSPERPGGTDTEHPGSPNQPDEPTVSAPNAAGTPDTRQGHRNEGGSRQDDEGTLKRVAAEEVSSLPPWAQKLIRDTRTEAAAHRTKARDAEARHQQMLDAIASALGLKDSEQQKDPAALTERLTASQAEARTLKVERAVDRAARRHDADEELLVAWLAHTGALTDLDPASEDFASRVDTAVADAVENNPKLKATPPAPPPARSGGEFTGGSGDRPPSDTSLSIEEHRARRRKRREVDSAP